MNEKEIYFEKNKNRISAVLESALKNKYSDFYRKKYASLDLKNISDLKDFDKIPILQKKELLDTPISERTFVPKEKIDYFSFGSGTVDSNKILIVPHINQPWPYLDEMKSLGVTNLLLLTNPLTSAIHRIGTRPRPGITTTQGLVTDVALSAKIAKQLGVDALVSMTSLLDDFYQELKKLDYNPNKILLIQLFGEGITKEKLDSFHSKFPKAKIFRGYGMSEIGMSVGHVCNYIANDPKRLHINENCFLEISGEGVEGPIVYTDLIKDKAFPMIKYDTGDVGTVIHEECKCGSKTTLVLLGRKNFDTLRFGGGTLYADLVESILGKYSIKNFQLHVYEVMDNSKLKIKIVLHIDPDVEANLEDVKKDITDNLQLNKGKFLNDLLNEEKITPLEVKIDHNLQEKIKKRKRIISHL